MPPSAAPATRTPPSRSSASGSTASATRPPPASPTSSSSRRTCSAPTPWSASVCSRTAPRGSPRCAWSLPARPSPSASPPSPASPISFAPSPTRRSWSGGTRTPRALDRRDRHDLHEQLRVRQPRLDGRAGRRVVGIDPRVPRLVHLGEVAHVGDPDRGGQQLGLVGAGCGEQLVHLLEDLLGLTLDPGRRVGGHLAGQVHRVAVNHRTTEALAGAEPLDRH